MMTDNRTTELLDGLRNVGNLHEFAELFGFDWHDDSDWTWHDVAVKMADDFEQAIAATLGSEPPYDELLRFLENDWNIKASWDGLRKFWNIELTEEGVRIRDGGTCKLEPLSALDVTLNMLDQTEWGACSECGCAVPMDARFCNECGKVVSE